MGIDAVGEHQRSGTVEGDPDAVVQRLGDLLGVIEQWKADSWNADSWNAGA